MAIDAERLKTVAAQWNNLAAQLEQDELALRRGRGHGKGNPDVLQGRAEGLREAANDLYKEAN